MQRAGRVLEPSIIEFVNWFAIDSQDFNEAHVNILVLNSSLTNRSILSWCLWSLATSRFACLGWGASCPTLRFHDVFHSSFKRSYYSAGMLLENQHSLGSLSWVDLGKIGPKCSGRMCCYSFQISWGLALVASRSFEGRRLSPFSRPGVSVAVLNRHSARRTSVSVVHLVDLRLWYQSKTSFVFRCLGWIWSDCRDRAHSLRCLTPWRRHSRSWAHLGSLFHRIGADLELASSGQQVAWMSLN